MLKPLHRPLPRTQFCGKWQLDTIIGQKLLTVAWQHAIILSSSHSWCHRIQNALATVRAKNTKIAENKWDTWKHLHQTQFTQLLEAEVLLQLNWNDPTAQEKLKLAQYQIQQIQPKRLEKQFTLVSPKWTRVGDRCNADFFHHHGPRHKQVRIKESI